MPVILTPLPVQASQSILRDLTNHSNNNAFSMENMERMQRGDPPVPLKQSSAFVAAPVSLRSPADLLANYRQRLLDLNYRIKEEEEGSQSPLDLRQSDLPPTTKVSTEVVKPKVVKPKPFDIKSLISISSDQPASAKASQDSLASLPTNHPTSLTTMNPFLRPQVSSVAVPLNQLHYSSLPYSSPESLDMYTKMAARLLHSQQQYLRKLSLGIERSRCQLVPSTASLLWQGLLLW